MKKKIYEIKYYTVNIDDIEEIRRTIIYYNEIGIEITREFYVDDMIIPSGYVEKNSLVSEQQDPL